MKILSFDIGIKNLAYCYVNCDNDNYNIIDWNVVNLCDIKKCSHCLDDAIYHKNITYFCKNHCKNTPYKLPIKKISIENLNKKKLEVLKNIADNYSISYDKKIKKCDLLNLINQDISNNYLEKICNKNTTDYDLINIGINLKKKLDEIFLESTSIDLILIENQIGPLAVRMKCLQCMLTQYFIDKNIKNIKFISSINKLKGFSDISTNYNERKKLSIQYLNQIIQITATGWNEFVNKHKKKDDLADCFLQFYWYLKNKLYCGNT